MAFDGADLEVAHYMRDEGISEPEARQRLHDQSLMGSLEQMLEDRLSPGAFGGMWVDREDGDRIAVALVPGRAGLAGVVARAEPVIAELGLGGRVNFVEARVSYRELSALRAAIEARVAGVNANAAHKIDVVEDVKTGTIELGVPSTLTPAQESALAEPDGPIASSLVRRVRKLERLLLQGRSNGVGDPPLESEEVAGTLVVPAREESPPHRRPSLVEREHAMVQFAAASRADNTLRAYASN